MIQWSCRFLRRSSIFGLGRADERDLSPTIAYEIDPRKVWQLEILGSAPDKELIKYLAMGPVDSEIREVAQPFYNYAALAAFAGRTDAEPTLLEFPRPRAVAK